VASSAGWATNITVPDQRSFIAYSASAPPSHQVKWISWPQLCRRLLMAIDKLGMLAAIGKSGILFHYPTVDIGSDQHDGTRAIPQQRDDTGLADSFGYLKTKLTHSGRKSRC